MSAIQEQRYHRPSAMFDKIPGRASDHKAVNKPTGSCSAATPLGASGADGQSVATSPVIYQLEVVEKNRRQILRRQMRVDKCANLEGASSAALERFRDKFGEHHVLLVERVGELHFVRSALPDGNTGLVVIHPFPIREASTP